MEGTLMHTRPFLQFMVSAAVIVAAAPTIAQQPSPGTTQPPEQPTVTLGPGLRPVPNYIGTVVPTPPVAVPAGFTPIFNGRDLTGWHVSKTARHGVTPDFHVVHGMI